MRSLHIKGYDITNETLRQKILINSLNIKQENIKINELSIYKKTINKSRVSTKKELIKEESNE